MILTKYSPGKACFLCENNERESELIKHHQCPSCTPTVTLGKSGQCVLEHMACHILFDPQTKASSQPCGLCLRPSPTCTFELKKGKGANASLQINSKTSHCANLMTFSYSVAAVSGTRSPCSNVPILCSWCPKDAPAVWKYNMSAHVTDKHCYVSLRDHEVAWKIGTGE